MERGRGSRCLASGVLLLVLCAGPLVAQPTARARGKETIAWVRGTVRDEAGAPIAGAKVYAHATYHGGLRMEGLLRTAIANEQGEYAIHGPGGLSFFSASLVTHVPGRPPALSWFDFPDTFHFDPLFDPPPPNPRWADIDLVVPSHGGAIEVLVMKDGRPLPSASVALRLEGADPFDTWGREGVSDELKALYDICRPTSQTGADGVAKFEGVTPGLYSLLAIEGPWRQRGLGWANEYQDWYLRSETRPYGNSQHVAVRAGEVSTHQISVFPHGSAATFDVVRDGKSWRKLERLDIGMAIASGERPTYGSRTGGEQSNGYRFETAGIAPVCFANATGGRTSPRTFPFYSADGVIAASPRLSNSLPIRLVADVSRGGMIRVRIEDAEGKPVAGKARFNAVKSGGHGIDSGEQDIAADGTVIAGFEPAMGWVQGSIAERSRFILSEKFGRVPTTEELVGRSEVLPQPFVAENNRLGEVTLREERVGYVRGRIKPPAGRKVSDYRVLIGRLEYQKGAGIYHDRRTGEFVAGPYRTGTTVFKFYPDRGQRSLFFKRVAVRAGEVTDVDIEISDDAEQMTPHQRLLTAQVVLDDGTTPARLAGLGYYSPSDHRAWAIGTTDTNGKARPRSFWTLEDADFTEPPETPQEEVAVAWAPGRHGAAIVPFPERLDEPLVIRLPPPISLRGKVVVEGDGETITNGTLIVHAQYQGRGKLDDWLSVETTAGADGAFELSGLTPGTYRVQAALDGVWLSPSVEFTAGDQAPSPIRLTIAPPGGPVLVQLSGQQKGSPAKLVVDRPSGPLCDRLWPKFLTPDGAGVVRVPALEAGRHVVRIGSLEKVIDVPSLETSEGKPVEVEFKLE